MRYKLDTREYGILQSFVIETGRKMIMCVSFSADVTKLGRGIGFSYFVIWTLLMESNYQFGLLISETSTIIAESEIRGISFCDSFFLSPPYL